MCTRDLAEFLFNSNLNWGQDTNIIQELKLAPTIKFHDLKIKLLFLNKVKLDIVPRCKNYASPP